MATLFLGVISLGHQSRPSREGEGKDLGGGGEAWRGLQGNLACLVEIEGLAFLLEAGDGLLAKLHCSRVKAPSG